MFVSILFIQEDPPRDYEGSIYFQDMSKTPSTRSKQKIEIRHSSIQNKKYSELTFLIVFVECFQVTVFDALPNLR